jgi:CheY-like chemotaxis protein
MESATFRIRGLINDLTRSLSGAIVHIDDLFMIVDNKSDAFDDMYLTNAQISRSLEIFLELRLDLLLLLEPYLTTEYAHPNDKHVSIGNIHAHKLNELLTVLQLGVDLLHIDKTNTMAQVDIVYNDIKKYITNLAIMNIDAKNTLRSDNLLSKESNNKNNSNYNLLIIDDDELVRNITSIALLQKGYRVNECSTARLAIDLFKKENGNYDLCLIDIGLPDMNGFQLAEKLMLRKKELKCLFVSGHDELLVKEQKSSSKKFNFLRKPFKMVQLIEGVEKAL